MIKDSRFLKIAIAGLATTAAFFAGRLTAPERGWRLAISNADPRFIEVTKDGEVRSEWQAVDDPEYEVLRNIMDIGPLPTNKTDKLMIASSAMYPHRGN